MINSDEIKAKAEQEEISTSNVQRDYIFSWILAGLYRQSNLADQLILKGGNMYRKAYFPSTRFSNDLDFTTESAVDRGNLLNELNGICEYIQSETGIRFDFDKNQINDEVFITKEKSSYKVRLYFKDFFGQDSNMTLKVNLDVNQFDKLYLPPNKTFLVHPYSDHEQLRTTLSAMSLEEALADKLKCLIQRRHSFDLFDLVHAIFIDKTLEVDKSKMMGVFLKKTIFESSPGAAKNLLFGVPFDFMRLYWSKLVCPKATKFSFEDAVQTFKSGLESFFEGFDVNDTGQLAFYPAEIRNKIFEAAQAKKLLRMTYHGYTREIEPYSLKYHVTKDGTGREYFFGFDRTGGSSGKQTIKAFLNHDVENIEVLDERFEPKYEIELSKVGEIQDDSNYGSERTRLSGILGRPTKEKTKIVRVPRKYGRGLDNKKYKVQCTVCGKVFYKANQYDLNLNKHKKKNGSKYYDDYCYGTYGTYVGMKKGD